MWVPDNLGAVVAPGKGQLGMWIYQALISAHGQRFGYSSHPYARAHR
jgi:hypothetical protein